MNIGFIGAGKVGCSLGKYFKGHGVNVLGYHDRQMQAAEEAASFTGTEAFAEAEALVCACDALFLTVPDGLIRTVAGEICQYPIEGKYICHCSGSISSEEALAGAGDAGAFAYSVHPLFAVSDRFGTYRELADAFFTLEGDPEHLDDMGKLLSEAGLRYQIIDPKSKSLYHLAAVVSSNQVLALIDAGVQDLVGCGFSEEDARAALTPLIMGNVRHGLEAGCVSALTGPVERGDTGTLKRHLSVIPEEDGRRLYRLLSKRLLLLAKQKNPGRDYSEMEDFLAGSGRRDEAPEDV